jgi:COMPASS component SPP1
MTFSSSFFTPELATNDSQPQQGHQTSKKETQTDMDDQSHNPQPIQDGLNSRSSPSNMPHSEKGQLAPPSSDDFDPTMRDNSVPKTAAAKKKKGIAAAVKAPKRTKPGAPGGAKKPRTGGPKKARTDASSKQPGGGGGGSTAGDDDGDSESDSGPYCLCRGPDDHRFMIACDRCEDWFHGACIGMDKHTGEKLVQKYICPNCSEGGRYTTRYKKMCSLAGCKEPALIYDAVRPSIFCTPAHCQAWWEQLIAALPRAKGAADHLTQEEFMGLLDAQPGNELADSKDDLPTSPWKLGKTPFGESHHTPTHSPFSRLPRPISLTPPTY